MSPTLFNISTADVNIITQGLDVTIILYADNMVLGSSKTVDRLEDWATDIDFKINKNKTVMMILRNAGRMAAEDKITLQGEKLQRVNYFRYLGITLQTTGLSFKIHIRESTTGA
ncbi:hypothetical protein ANN_27882 [Periplaneta americana]|uniref:Reverse transcriptase domain-containing protein n=1 Tax=Periplaneta americana TaxID=6978 RepID=A0ABQ8RVI5_PERAM|nr:hypothetical protein ANN_27882 [Periplaneta americana]